jgi:hypothetical protein
VTALHDCDLWLVIRAESWAMNELRRVHMTALLRVLLGAEP